MSFEAYKREALALERQLEDKVNRYQQVNKHSEYSLFMLMMMLCYKSVDGSWLIVRWSVCS